MKKSIRNKPLPTPQTTAFGRKKRFEEDEGQEPLTADRMAAAMAEGKLDEFLKQEMPDNEYARNLATMMMGMTGMMPTAAVPQGSPTASGQPQSPGGAKTEQTIAAGDVPKEVQKAIQGGDVQGLMNMLRQEHQKRRPEAYEELPKNATAQPAQMQDMPGIDKEQIDSMIQIAKENNVTVDWMILRAIKFYVQEYQRTGKL